MFLKLKNDEVDIKVRGWSYGRKHKKSIPKEDTSLKTVSTEDLMLSWIIDAMEGNGVSISDIPGAFLQTDHDKGDIHIKMEGVMVYLLE